VDEAPAGRDTGRRDGAGLGAFANEASAAARGTGAGGDSAGTRALASGARPEAADVDVRLDDAAFDSARPAGTGAWLDAAGAVGARPDDAGLARSASRKAAFDVSVATVAGSGRLAVSSEAASAASEPARAASCRDFFIAPWPFRPP
jgi:hypothetical protein